MKTRNSHGLLQLHVGREALAYCQCASALISGNKALFVSVDLIGEKNQVILECQINFKYELNIQNVKHKNEQFYKLANDYVSQIKFDFCL